jgi:hypothetical protein
MQHQLSQRVIQRQKMMSAMRAAFLGSCRRVRGMVAPPTTVNRICLLAAELDQIADAGAGDPGICNGPGAEVGRGGAT